MMVPNGLWTVDGNRYFADLPQAPSFISHVFEGGQIMQVARFPNTNPNDPGAEFRRNSTGTGNTIIDEGLPGGAGYWQGTWAVVRTANWQYEMREVIAHTENGTTDALVLRNNYPLDPSINLNGKDWGYYLVNKLEELDAPGEWFYDVSIGRLYAKSLNPGQAPTEVEVVTEQRGLYMVNCNNITVKNLRFSHYTEAGIRPAGPSSLSYSIAINNCAFNDIMIGVRDLSETGLPGRTIQDCVFERCMLYGVRATWANGSLIDCTFKDIGLWSGFRGLPQPNGASTAVNGNEYGSYSAVSLQGDAVMIERNSIYRAGNNGISFSGTGAMALNNHVTEALSLVNDGAAITFDYCDGCLVVDNIVASSLGVLWGQATNTGNNEEKTTGIYFGNQSIVNSLVQGNTISDCSAGILIDHAPGFFGNKVRNNTVFGCDDAQMFLQDLGEHGADPYQQSFDTEVSGNILYCLKGDQVCLIESQAKATTFSGTQALVDFGQYEGNFYHNPFSDVAVLRLLSFGRAGVEDYLPARELAYSLDGWRHLYQEELTGSRSPLRLKEYAFTPTDAPHPILSNNLNDPQAQTLWSASSTSPDPVHTLFPDGAQGLRLVDGNWLENWSNGHYFQIGNGVDPGAWRVRFRMRSPDADMVAVSPVYDFATNAVYELRNFQLGPDWKVYEALFDVPNVASLRLVNAFVNTQYGTDANLLPTSTLELDWTVFQAGTLDPDNYATEVLPNHRLFYHCPLPGSENDPLNVASSGGNLTIPGEIGQCWSDVFGNFYAAGDQIPLDEWASIILFRMDVPTSTLAFTNGVHTVSGTVTITENQNVAGSIVVPNGATLTIDGAHIGFAASTQSLTTNITVQPGGTLVLKNGATLRNWMGCGSAPEMWDGVKVLGVSDAYEHAPEQGRVLMESGARITNAKCGILAGFGEVDDPTTVGFDDTNYWVGGSVALRHATFENNVYDVVLHPGGWPATAPYNPENANYQGLALFENCTFRTTRALNNPSLYPKAHVRLTGRDASVFRSCTFANERTDIPSLTSAQLGHGIEAFNSSFTVVSCLPNCADGDVPPNTFRNLDHGIHSTTSWGSLYNIARNCRFKDNVCGVFIDGETGLALRDNAVELGRWHGIDMPTMDELYWLNHHRGLFTTRSWGLNIQDNTLARSPGTPGSALLEGIVVGYSEDHNEVVYRNTASNLTMGFVGEGISADVNGGNPNTIGLQFQCNTNAQNATNLMSRKANGDQDFEFLHTIRGIQGNPNLAAGNSFDQNTVWDFAKNTTQVPIITYYYDAAFADQVLVNHPADVAPLTITGNANACGTGPGGLVPGGGLVTVAVLKPILSTSKYEYGTLRYQYEQLIDGGNTDEVVGEIIAAWPQDIWDLRAYLLGHSPYLSVDALKELINKQGVPVAIKLEVCVANPEATQKEGFLKWAELEALYPLPAYALAAIEASWDTKTFRFALEAQMAGKHTRMTQAANHLLELFAADSVRSHPDSLRWVWQQLRTNAARYAETGLLLRQQRYTEAQAVLNAMPAEKELRPKEQSERQRMLSYVGLLATAKADGRDPYRLKANEVQQLETLVGDHYDRPAVWASNLLCAQYKLCRAPYTGGKPEPKSIRLHDYSNTSAALGSQLRIQPNPANNWAAFTYSLPGNSATLQLRIRDASGRVVHTLQAGGEEGQVVWDTRGTAPGVHTVELLREGQVERTERLIVQP
jgi:hypothetical protein